SSDVVSALGCIFALVLRPNYVCLRHGSLLLSDIHADTLSDGSLFSGAGKRLNPNRILLSH
ncbi:unnamed protein product, partial [marine sediment metagenome]